VEVKAGQVFQCLKVEGEMERKREERKRVIKRRVPSSKTFLVFSFKPVCQA